MVLPVYAGRRVTADLFNAMRMHMSAQSTNVDVTNAAVGSDPQASEVVIPVEAGSVYWFQSVITYSATINSDFGWFWAVPTGTSMPRQTIAFDSGASPGLQDYHPVNMRSPAASTATIVAGGTNGSGNDDPGNFHCVYEHGSIQVGGTSGVCQLMWGQGSSHSDVTRLRGIQRTRVFYQRVQ